MSFAQRRRAPWIAAVGEPELDGDDDGLPVRPKTRADCVGGPRPCPWVSCRHHLYLDVNAETGTIKLVRPDLEVHELERSCSLDVADQGEHTLEQVGLVLNITRERTRQLEEKAVMAMRRVRAMKEAG